MNRFSWMRIRRRVAALFLIATACMFFLALRLAYLQVVQADHLKSLALEQRLRPVPLLAERGKIYDRNMNVLAASMSFEAAYAVPIEVDDPHGTAEQLAPVLGVDVDWLVERLQRRRAVEWLKLRLTPDQADAVRRLGLPGIGVQERPLRFYPNNELAAAVIGFAGIDNQGLEGVEAYYDRFLKGEDGMVVRERDAAGRAIPGGIERRIEPTDGFDLVLTIDKYIQYIAERELERGVLEADADWGVFVGVNPKTGEVLAMANYPSFNPNEYAQYPPETWRNRAVVGYYEPGSTFKIITAAAALETGVATLDSVFVDPVTLEIGGGRVSCWRPGGHGRQTFVEAMQNSCNPIFSILAEKMTASRFHKYVTAFGFGSRTGIDFPGESPGAVPGPDARLLTWANVGFGQGVGTTALQMVMAVSAVANGGELLRPYLVKRVLDAEGRVIEERGPEVVRRVISQKTAEDLRQVLRSVVENGSGRQAEIPGYAVAGKTGTAQIASPTGGYLSGPKSNMASFVAFAPVEDPVFAGIVMLYKVGREPSYGGLWAAPVFGRIAAQVLDYLGVPRREVAPEENDSLVRVPNVINLDLGDAEEILLAHGLRVVVEGELAHHVDGHDHDPFSALHGHFILDQTPPPGTRVAPGTRVVLTLYEEAQRGFERVVVPNLLGRSMKDAATHLAVLGLRIEIEGTGFAVAQDPLPGVEVTEGSIVSVRFAPPGN